MIPAFLNPAAGTAGPAADALAADPRFRVVPCEADTLARAIEEEVRCGARRILVAGGDGTIAAAATVVAELGAEMAVLPAGTLNHFARDLGIPTEPAEALEVAAGVSTRAVDIGYVNGRIFLNTSSVGAYVALVHRRQRVRRWLGYYLGGVVAAVVQLLRLRTMTVELDSPAGHTRTRTPLFFLGVGERDLSLPAFGDRVANGDDGALHAILVHGGGRARLLALALSTARHGVWRVARTPHVDSFLVDRCRVELRRPRVHVALDGEIHRLEAPLEYRIARGGLTVVAPPPAEKA